MKLQLTVLMTLMNTLVLLLPLQLFYAPRNQLNFLQLLHRRAEQSITALCRGSVVYYDSRNKNYDSAANLLLFNGKVINTHLDRRVRGEGGFVQLEVNIKDDCMVRVLPCFGSALCK